MKVYLSHHDIKFGAEPVTEQLLLAVSFGIVDSNLIEEEEDVLKKYVATAPQSWYSCRANRVVFHGKRPDDIEDKTFRFRLKYIKSLNCFFGSAQQKRTNSKEFGLTANNFRRFYIKASKECRNVIVYGPSKHGLRTILRGLVILPNNFEVYKNKTFRVIDGDSYNYVTLTSFRLNPGKPLDTDYHTWLAKPVYALTRENCHCVYGRARWSIWPYPTKKAIESVEDPKTIPFYHDSVECLRGFGIVTDEAFQLRTIDSNSKILEVIGENGRGRNKAG